jgi:signal transduction histidine kinase
VAQTHLAKDLEQLRVVANEAYEYIYCLIAGLRLGPSGDLSDALRARALVAAQRAGFKTTLTTEGVARPLETCIQREIVFIVREALNNVEKHAQANQVGIHLHWAEAALYVRVSDDGVGLAPDTAWPAGHFGLAIMRERAAELGGTISIRSEARGGAVVELSVPL